MRSSSYLTIILPITSMLSNYHSANCTIHGARRLLQQLQMAEGFRAIAIKSSDSSLSLGETTLTTPPRLFLLLPNKSSSNESPERANDGFFEENLNRLLVDCTLPLPEKITYTTVPREEQASNNIIDPFEDKAQGRPEEASTATSQGTQVISADRALKKAGSLPSEGLTLPLPLLHPSINGWRATSMPTWTPCTHDYHNENIVNDPIQSPTSSETSTTYGSKVENGKMSPVLASGNAMSTGVGIICTHHQRDTSNSDNTVITVDTSIHSQSDLEEERVCEIRREQRAYDHSQADQGDGTPSSNSAEPNGVARSPGLARPITLQNDNINQTRHHPQSATESCSYRRNVSIDASGFRSRNGSKKDTLSSNQARGAARPTWSTSTPSRVRVHGGSILSLKQPERIIIPPENTVSNSVAVKNKEEAQADN